MARRKNTTPKTPTPHHHPTPPCNRSSSVILDLLIAVVVLFSSAFLIISFYDYVYESLSLILPPFSTVATHFDRRFISIPYSLFSVFLIVCFAALTDIFIGRRLRRWMCGRKGCRGLRNSPESDWHVQGEDLLLAGDVNEEVKNVNELPWKEGSKDNPDYDRVRAELRKRAPPNGRAVMLFRAHCGCPVSKLEEWGPRRGRRNKKNLALAAGGDNR
ncbi:hypothetical protein CASFOL_029758 [Castilleja foliolosa]|uniref:Ribosomal protein L34e superfamily protein n=1 Tax=Castilleja foliolosa TaxID=1961234 RepID=A0ABD3CA15_9LAMI